MMKGKVKFSLSFFDNRKSNKQQEELYVNIMYA